MDFTSELVIGFVLFDLITMGCIAAWLVRRNRHRTRDLRAAAEELGLLFSQCDAGLVGRLAGLPLIMQAIRPRIRNVLSDASDDLDARIFDCHITVDGGSEYVTLAQTAVYLQSPDLRLPCFAWRTDEAARLLREPPELTEVTDLKGFESTGRRLFVRNTPAAREFFDSELIGHLETFSGLCVEAEGDRLLVYRFHHRAKPGELRDLLTEGIELLGTLRKAISEQLSAVL
ncbi:MAG: hypothetical protein HY000_37120 [Planctomycetes bacterium]|nr:hypothetical protein [Planctomycetota bacterium]